jgi:hypothetical protein
MQRKPIIWTVYVPAVGMVYAGADEREARRTARVYRGAEVTEERMAKR